MLRKHLHAWWQSVAVVGLVLSLPALSLGSWARVAPTGLLSSRALTLGATAGEAAAVTTATLSSDVLSSKALVGAVRAQRRCHPFRHEDGRRQREKSRRHQVDPGRDQDRRCGRKEDFHDQRRRDQDHCADGGYACRHRCPQDGHGRGFQPRTYRNAARDRPGEEHLDHRCHRHGEDHRRYEDQHYRQDQHAHAGRARCQQDHHHRQRRAGFQPDSRGHPIRPQQHGGHEQDYRFDREDYDHDRRNHENDHHDGQDPCRDHARLHDDHQQARHAADFQQHFDRDLDRGHDRCRHDLDRKDDHHEDDHPPHHRRHDQDDQHQFNTAAPQTSVTNLEDTGSGEYELAGYVYLDTNGNGIKDSSDWAVADATVTLYALGGTVPLETVYTASDGKYVFNNISDTQSYTVKLWQSPSLNLGPKSIIGPMARYSKWRTMPAAITSSPTLAWVRSRRQFLQLQRNLAGHGRLISKRMYVGTLTPAVTVVPVDFSVPITEPSTWALLAVAGALLGCIGLRCARHAA